MASSIRMIPQPDAVVAQPVDTGNNIFQSNMLSGEGAPGPTANPQSITVTRTLDVKPATPRSLTSGIMYSTGPRSFVQSPACSSDLLSTPSSAPRLRLPNIPNISSIDLNEPLTIATTQPPSRPKTAPGNAESRSLPPPQPTLPPFIQSRRWARMCDAPRPKTPGPERVILEEAGPMTLREVSFEQQRAAWKQSLPVSKVETVNENESVVSAQGFCRPVSLPTWQLIRAARSMRARSEPSNTIFRKLATHRASKPSNHSRRQSVEKTPPRMSRSSQMDRKRAVSDLRKRAGMNHRREISSHVVNLDVISTDPMIGRRPSSPVPSLHDPEKAKRFSEECEALLTNKDLEKDFLAPPGLSSRCTTSASKPRGAENCDSLTKSSIVGAMSKPSQQVSISSPSSMLAAPQPPVRTSRKGGATLATMVQMTKPTCIPILNGLKEEALAVPDDASKQAVPQHGSPRPPPSGVPFRMASVASAVNETDKGPRAAKSTDTLTLIEAQIRATPRPSLVERLKQKTVVSAAQLKQGGPSGTPPERPLPDLPAESPSTHSNTTARASWTSSKRPSKQSQTLPSAETEVTTQRGLSRPAADVGSLSGLAIKYTDKEVLEEQTPGTLASLCSQESRDCDVSTKHRYSRHDKTLFRAERIKELKRRIKADMEREHRIREEREENEDGHKPELTGVCKDVDPLLPPQPGVKLQSSLDQLDQFPAVPASRPASETSHNSGPSRRAHSCTRSHVRKTSKASSRHSYRPAMSHAPAHQVLGTSQIKVLVDSDPVTGHFRAGAMTPEPSPVRDEHSLEASPRKATLRNVRPPNIPSRIDEDKQADITCPRRMTSLRSHRSHASAISARHSTAGSHQSRRQPSADTPTGSMLVSSSEDDNLLLSVGRSGKRKLRRRWNSNDIRTVQTLYNDLEKYHDTLIRQEQELQKQREEIQMMVRVFAPMRRSQDLRTAMFPAEQQEFVDPGVRLEDIRSTHASSAASTCNAVRNSYAPALSDKMSLTHATSPARNERRMSKSSSKARLDAASAALDSVIKERPISNVSSASVTTDLSRGNRSSKENSAAEGSMTDPFEYEGGSGKAADLITSEKCHVLAVHGKTMSEPLGWGQSLTSRPRSQETISVSSSAQARENVQLHRPPPVASVLPKATLSEEEVEDMFLKTPVPKVFGAGIATGVPRSGSALSGESVGKERRLSVNHVFTRTEEMDRMLSVISSLK